MRNETYIVFFGMLGLFLISLHRLKYLRAPSRIEYRYIKRSFEKEQEINLTGQHDNLMSGEWEGDPKPQEQSDDPKNNKQPVDSNPL